MKQFRRNILLLSLALTLSGLHFNVCAEPYDSQASAIVVNQPQVRVLNGLLEINVPGDDEVSVDIYALTGQVIKSFKAVPGITTVDLPKGYYIVKCDRVSCRVVVK